MQRYRTVIVLALLVIVPLAVAVVAVRFFFPGSTPEPVQTGEPPPAAVSPVEQPEMRRVFAAARDLPVGTLLREEDLTELELPVAEVRRGHVAADEEGPERLETLRGHAVRERLAADEPLTRASVVGPGQRGFLAAVLQPGTRAVTIRLAPGSSRAGLIDPGDRVDVILTATLQLDDDTEGVLTRTILEDARVVAVDSLVGTGAGTDGAGEPLERTEITTATLEVSPAQADRLALGEHEGTLSLAVRPLAAAGRASGEAVDMQDLLALPAEQEAEAPPTAAVSPVAPPKARRVFAAARDLPVGTLLREEDLTELELPAGEVRRGHVAADEKGKGVETLRGHAVREPLAAGAPLTRAAVVGPGRRGFLAAVLQPGTRAVTIALAASASHAGLIDPGDRVDVILTAELQLDDGTQSVFTRTILEDARVVAVDRRAGTGAEMDGAGGQLERTQITTATLEVSPAQADRLALGEHQGTLSVAVRPLAAAGRTSGEAVDLEDLLAPPAKKEDEVKTVRVIRGDAVTEQVFPGPGALRTGGGPAVVRVVPARGAERNAEAEDGRSGADAGTDGPLQ